MDKEREKELMDLGLSVKVTYRIGPMPRPGDLGQKEDAVHTTGTLQVDADGGLIDVAVTWLSEEEQKRQRAGPFSHPLYFKDGALVPGRMIEDGRIFDTEKEMLDYLAGLPELPLRAAQAIDKGRLFLQTREEEQEKRYQNWMNDPAVEREMRLDMMEEAIREVRALPADDAFALWSAWLNLMGRARDLRDIAAKMVEEQDRRGWPGKEDLGTTDAAPTAGAEG